MDASIRSRSIAISIGIHIGIFLILFFVVMTTPIPPFPEEGGGGGVLVDIGTVELASGDIQPTTEQVSVDPAYDRSKPTNSPEEEFATQDNEEAPVVKTTPAKKNTTVKKNTTTTTTTQQVKTEPVRTADPRAIYGGRNNNSRSQGTATTGSGDQGDRMGDPNSLYAGRGGRGGSGTGTGTGNGSGSGPGTGSGNGSGISFALTGRNMIRAPQVNDKSQETGKVVVDITVDKSGTVIGAIPGGRGSTTTSAYLFRLAKEAAMRAKFNPSDEADIQKGTMTFIFVVQ